ncbi:hypothetical protein, partial [Frankia sp. CpI1-P]
MVAAPRAVTAESLLPLNRSYPWNGFFGSGGGSGFLCFFGFGGGGRIFLSGIVEFPSDLSTVLPTGIHDSAP